MEYVGKYTIYYTKPPFFQPSLSFFGQKTPTKIIRGNWPGSSSADRGLLDKSSSLPGDGQ